MGLDWREGASGVQEQTEPLVAEGRVKGGSWDLQWIHRAQNRSWQGVGKTLPRGDLVIVNSVSGTVVQSRKLPNSWPLALDPQGHLGAGAC